MGTHYHAIIAPSGASLENARDHRWPDAGERFAYSSAMRAAEAAHYIARTMGLAHWGVFDCQRAACNVEVTA